MNMELFKAKVENLVVLFSSASFLWPYQFLTLNNFVELCETYKSVYHQIS